MMRIRQRYQAVKQHVTRPGQLGRDGRTFTAIGLCVLLAGCATTPDTSDPVASASPSSTSESDDGASSAPPIPCGEAEGDQGAVQAAGPPVSNAAQNIWGDARFGGTVLSDTTVMVKLVDATASDCTALADAVPQFIDLVELYPVTTPFAVLAAVQERMVEALSTEELTGVSISLDTRRNALRITGENIPTETREQIEQLGAEVPLIFINEPIVQMTPVGPDG